MIAVHELISLQASSRGRLLGHRRLAVGLVSPLEALRVWRFRRRYRADLRRLLRLGTYLIDDIGLGLREAIEEARKPFWRA